MKKRIWISLGISFAVLVLAAVLDAVRILPEVGECVALPGGAVATLILRAGPESGGLIWILLALIISVFIYSAAAYYVLWVIEKSKSR